MAPLRAPAAALLALLAPPALAAPARGLRGAGHGAAAPLASRRAESAGAGALFSALDQDGNGTVTWQEVEANGCCDPWPAELLFEAADSDGDGLVWPEDVQATAGTLQRRAAESGMERQAWEEALLQRATALRARALGATASDEGNATEADSDNGALDGAVGDKNIWLPTRTCEKYTMRSCSGVDEALETCIGNSTCADTGDCVCPDGFCASTWIGHCVECASENKSRCVQNAALVNYSSWVPGDGKRR